MNLPALHRANLDGPHDRTVAVLTSAWWIASVVLIVLGFADGELVCDDAYYYYEIARNAALGQGFTFDSLAPTNGFHPLWAWMLVPLFYVLRESIWAPIHASLVLSALFTAGTALCIHALFARRGRPQAGVIGAVLWLLNPFTLVLSFRGLEGPLNTLLIAALFLSLDGVRRRGTFTGREVVQLGALTGLCLLARTDNVLLLATLGAVLAVELFRRRRSRDLAGHGVRLAGTSALVTLPWVAWNLATFGTVVQTSFRSKQLFELYGQLPEWLPARISDPAGVVRAVGGAFRNLGLVAEYNAKYIMGEEWAPIDDGYRLLYPLSAIAVGLFLLPRAGRALGERFRAYRGTAGALGPIGLFCAVHFVWYALVGRDYYNWYFLPPVLAFSMFAAESLGFLASLRSRAARVAVLALIGGMLIATPGIVGRHVSGPEPFQDEIQFLTRIRPHIERTPPGSRLGSWNAGANGYFASFHAPDRYVVNLDGLVNNDIPELALDRAYEGYLLEHIDYLIEPPGPMTWVVGVSRTREFVRRHVGPGLRIRPEDEAVILPSAR
jgi:hypothetical protein